ncbi:MAG: hypothetical protein V3U08_01785 [Nitrospirales bacterium]
MQHENTGVPAGQCDACGAQGMPLMKVSLGKDFFGRDYDRLSPSADRSPKWYCKDCSLHKNLQRDYRDIKAEFEKLTAGDSSELPRGDRLQRAHVRLIEIAAILEGHKAESRLLDLADVQALLRRMHAPAGSPSIPG